MKTKRFFAMLLMSMLLLGVLAPLLISSIAAVTPGELVSFGMYPQSKVTNPALITQLDAFGAQDDVSWGGERYAFMGDDWFLYEPIEWRVLDVDGSSAYLLADKVLDAKAYHSATANVSFTNTAICLWLNGAFAQHAFGPTGYIQQNYDGTYVSLPSSSDVHEAAYGFANNQSRMAEPTEYAVAANVYLSGTSTQWWLYSAYTSSCGSTVGYIDYNGDMQNKPLLFSNPMINDSRMGVRPVIKVDPNAIYTVTYNANGGINPPAAQTKIHGVPLTLTTDEPTRDGYIFLGWSEDPIADDYEHLPGGTYTADANTTLYAVWEPVGYQLRFFYGNGTLPKLWDAWHDTDFYLNTVLTLTPYTHPGCELLGWSHTPGTAAAQYLPNGVVRPNSNADYYAVWRFSRDVNTGENVSVTPADAFDPDTEMRVSVTGSGTIVGAPADQPALVVKYNITFYIGTTVTQPNTPVTVRLSVPDAYFAEGGLAGDLIVVHKGEEIRPGIEWIDGKCYVVFQANSFSEYAIVRAAKNTAPLSKGIFGTNAKWTGAWWHYILFFFFGFIWMWF